MEFITSTPTPKSQREFLEEILQVAYDKDCNPQIIYPLLAKNLDKLDENFTTIFQDWAAQELSKVKPAGMETQWIAITIGELSTLISNFPLGNQSVNLEIAISRL
jgi:hypothetical protein